MRINTSKAIRATLLILLLVSVTMLSTRLQADTGTCGFAMITLPFTDVAAGNVFFCSIAEAYFSGLSNGTSPTTYSPSVPVPREQMAAFVTRTMDQSLKRGSTRASLNQFWTPMSANGFGLTSVGIGPEAVESDGVDLWVANLTSATVSRVRASDGKLLDTWTGASGAFTLLAAKGRIFVTGQATSGNLYEIDPTQPAGVVTPLLNTLPDAPRAIAFDGARIWMTTAGGVYSVTLNPLVVTTVTTGFINPLGVLYDGANIWVTDVGTAPGSLLRLDSNGAVIQTVSVGTFPYFPVFDGTNIWVPNLSANSVTVVRASTGAVLATLTLNGLNGPRTAAFDGERILVTNPNGESVSLWKAADLSALGSVSTGSGIAPYGACSDGLNFWITLADPNGNTDRLARF